MNIYQFDFLVKRAPPDRSDIGMNVMAEDDAISRFGTPVGPWIKTFAWRPRFTHDAGTVWLCRVWKRHNMRREYLDSCGGDEWWFQYRRYAPPKPASAASAAFKPRKDG